LILQVENLSPQGPDLASITQLHKRIHGQESAAGCHDSDENSAPEGREAFQSMMVSVENSPHSEAPGHDHEDHAEQADGMAKPVHVHLIGRKGFRLE